MCECSRTILPCGFRKLSGQSCRLVRQGNSRSTQSLRYQTTASVPPLWDTRVSQPGSLPSSQRRTSPQFDSVCPQCLTMSQFIGMSLPPSFDQEKTVGVIGVLPMVRFHHHVCGQLHDSQLKPFFPLQKPLEDLRVSISSLGPLQ